MQDVQISKHFKNGRHDGFRKYVFGRMFHLVTGTSLAHEERAKLIAARLVAKGEELRRLNGIWTQPVIAEVFNVPEVVLTPATHDISQIVPEAAAAVPAPASSNTDIISLAPLPPLSSAPSAICLFAAMERYKDAERLRFKGRATSVSTVCRAARSNSFWVIPLVSMWCVASSNCGTSMAGEQIVYLRF